MRHNKVLGKDCWPYVQVDTKNTASMQHTKESRDICKGFGLMIFFYEKQPVRFYRLVGLTAHRVALTAVSVGQPLVV